MKKKTIILLAGAAVTVCVLTPILAPSSKHQALTLAATLLSSASAVMTMTLAILLFNRFGVEQDVLKKQFDSVLSLLTTLREMRFLMQATEGEGEVMPQLTPLNPFAVPTFEMYYGRTIAFNGYVLKKLEPLHAHLYDVFLPVSVVQALEPITPSVLSTGFDPDTKAKCAFHFVGEGEGGEEETVYLIYNGAEMTLIDFLLKWSDIVDAINAWLQEHAANAPVLNIRHLTKKDAEPTSALYSESAPSVSSEAVT